VAPPEGRFRYEGLVFSGPQTVPHEGLGITRLVEGELGPILDGDPGVPAGAPVDGRSHPKVKTWCEAAPGPQVEEQERALEARAQVTRREHPQQEIDEAKVSERVAEKSW
jgi:hypothetical protein